MLQSSPAAKRAKLAAKSGDWTPVEGDVSAAALSAALARLSSSPSVKKG